MEMKVASSVKALQTLLSALIVLSTTVLNAQSLPDALTLFSGKKVNTKKEWYTFRQPEIKSFFEREVYGRQPNVEDFAFHYKTIEEETSVLEGKAFRKQVRMMISNKQQDTITVDFLVYYPVEAKHKRVPVFTLLNYGNHTLSDDPLIHLSVSSLYTNNQARASYSRRFPIETIVDSGCAVITSCYENFIPDDPNQNYFVFLIVVFTDATHADRFVNFKVHPVLIASTFHSLRVCHLAAGW